MRSILPGFMFTCPGCRRATTWVMLALYGLITSGLPLPLGGPAADSPAAQRLAAKDRSQPFPCMNKPCGCRSATHSRRNPRLGQGPRSRTSRAYGPRAAADFSGPILVRQVLQRREQGRVCRRWLRSRVARRGDLQRLPIAGGRPGRASGCDPCGTERAPGRRAGRSVRRRDPSGDARLRWNHGPVDGGSRLTASARPACVRPAVAACRHRRRRR